MNECQVSRAREVEFSHTINYPLADTHCREEMNQLYGEMSKYTRIRKLAVWVSGEINQEADLGIIFSS
jgi:hypothetical protein